MPLSELVIFANGKVSPCCNHLKLQLGSPEATKGIMEDIRTSALQNIWQRGFPSLRRAMSTGELLETCRICSQMEERAAQWPEAFWQAECIHYRNINDYSGGLGFTSRELELNPESALLHHHAGEFHMELEDYESAIIHLSQAVGLNPGQEWTHFSLGKCHYLTGSHREAEKEFRRDISLTSNRLSHYHSWLFLAMAADALNDETGCQNALVALKEFPDFFGKELKLEREFLSKLKRETRLPEFLSALPLPKSCPHPFPRLRLNNKSDVSFYSASRQ